MEWIPEALRYAAGGLIAILVGGGALYVGWRVMTGRWPWR